MNIIKKTGEFSSDLLPEAVKNLAEMQSLSDDDFPFWKQVHKFL
jgi:ribosomal RNA-processing protein 12